MKRYKIEALIVAIGIAMLGLFISNGLARFSEGARLVTVKGLAEREVMADRVIFPLAFKELGNNLPKLYQDINAKNEIIISFLESKGISRDDISVGAIDLTDLEADRYNSSQYREYRYNATSVVTVTTHEVEKVRNVISEQGELLNRGVALVGDDYRYRVSYSFTKLNDIKPDMIEDATKSARESAEKFAEDSRSKLGKIKRAVQGQFSISNRDDNTPYIKSVRVVTTVDYFLED